MMNKRRVLTIVINTTDTLDKTKVTGIEPVDKAQDGVNNLVSGQFGKGGALQGVGDTFSKEGVNRAERGGKDDSVSYRSSPETWRY